MLLQLDVHWNVPGWYLCSTENKPCKQVCARTSVPWTCLPHGLQCLCVRGACCPSLLKQLVILSFFEGTHRHRNVLFQLDVHWNVPGWYECSTENKPRKQVCARASVSWTCLAHGLQCLRDGRACCPVVPKQLVICRFLWFHRRRSRCCFKLLFHWTGPGRFEFPTQ